MLFKNIWCDLLTTWHHVREVKELDLNSNGLCPHRFEPCWCRFFFFHCVSQGKPQSVGFFFVFPSENLKMSFVLYVSLGKPHKVSVFFIVSLRKTSKCRFFSLCFLRKTSECRFFLCVSLGKPQSVGFSLWFP